MLEMKSIDISDRPKLFILAGMPGCGKTTWAHRFFPHSTIVSTDKIRLEMAVGDKVPHSYTTDKQVFDATKNDEVFKTFHQELGRLLGFTIIPHFHQIAVADATNLNASARDDLYKLAAYHDAERHLVFFNNPYASIMRNKKRKGSSLVPEEAMEKMLEKFGESRTAILKENYDSITTIQDTQ